MTEEEKFFAWLDDELGPEEAAEVEARVASDSKLAELAEQHRSMQARLGHAFAPVAAAPVPGRLMRSITANDRFGVVDLASRRKTARPSLPQWALLAATLVVGVFAGTLLPRQQRAVQLRDGAIYASGDLGRALNAQLASAPSGGPVRVGITFRDNGGAVCRTFNGDSASGLACRSHGQWQVRGLFPAAEGQASEYRMAGGMNPGLAALLDSSMAGEPFDASQEADAKKRGWR